MEPTLKRNFLELYEGNMKISRKIERIKQENKKKEEALQKILDLKDVELNGLRKEINKLKLQQSAVWRWR